MIKIQDLKLNITIIILLLAITTIQYIKPEYKKPKLSGQETNYTIDSSVLSMISLGQDKLISSYLWMNTLLFSDHDHVKDGEISWMYHRFKLISDLNPKFYENYYYGGIYLSIIKDDTEYAEKHYAKGLKEYENDHFLLWNRAFNLCHELKRCEDALPFYIKLFELYPNRYPAAGRIAAKIQNGLGLETEAYQILLKTYESLPDNNVIKDKTAQTLYQLKSQIDLKCLNSEQNSQCEKLDFNGKAYLYENGKYYSDLKYNERLYIK